MSAFQPSGYSCSTQDAIRRRAPCSNPSASVRVSAVLEQLLTDLASVVTLLMALVPFVYWLRAHIKKVRRCRIVWTILPCQQREEGRIVAAHA